MQSFFLLVLNLQSVSDSFVNARCAKKLSLGTVSCTYCLSQGLSYLKFNGAITFDTEYGDSSAFVLDGQNSLMEFSLNADVNGKSSQIFQVLYLGTKYQLENASITIRSHFCSELNGIMSFTRNTKIRNGVLHFTLQQANNQVFGLAKTITQIVQLDSLHIYVHGTHGGALGNRVYNCVIMAIHCLFHEEFDDGNALVYDLNDRVLIQKWVDSRYESGLRNDYFDELIKNPTDLCTPQMQAPTPITIQTVFNCGGACQNQLFDFSRFELRDTQKAPLANATIINFVKITGQFVVSTDGSSLGSLNDIEKIECLKTTASASHDQFRLAGIQQNTAKPLQVRNLMLEFQDIQMWNYNGFSAFQSIQSSATFVNVQIEGQYNISTQAGLLVYRGVNQSENISFQRIQVSLIKYNSTYANSGLIFQCAQAAVFFDIYVKLIQISGIQTQEFSALIHTYSGSFLLIQHVQIEAVLSDLQLSGLVVQKSQSQLAAVDLCVAVESSQVTSGGVSPFSYLKGNLSNMTIQYSLKNSSIDAFLSTSSHSSTTQNVSILSKSEADRTSCAALFYKVSEETLIKNVSGEFKSNSNDIPQALIATEARNSLVAEQIMLKQTIYGPRMNKYSGALIAMFSGRKQAHQVKRIVIEAEYASGTTGASQGLLFGGIYMQNKLEVSVVLQEISVVLHLKGAPQTAFGSYQFKGASFELTDVSVAYGSTLLPCFQLLGLSDAAPLIDGDVSRLCLG